MNRAVAALIAAVLLTGCGPYRITYRFPSKQELAESKVVTSHHAHGIGLGGGGYFWMGHQMFPALIDYTGEKEIAEICPDGVYEVSHHTKFWHNAAAAMITWLILINVYHPSTVEWTCAKAPPPPAPPQIDALPTPAPAPAPAPAP
jgi:hypothetical protein